MSDGDAPTTGAEGEGGGEGSADGLSDAIENASGGDGSERQVVALASAEAANAEAAHRVYYPTEGAGPRTSGQIWREWYAHYLDPAFAESKGDYYARVAITGLAGAVLVGAIGAVVGTGIGAVGLFGATMGEAILSSAVSGAVIGALLGGGTALLQPRPYTAK